MNHTKTGLLSTGATARWFRRKKTGPLRPRYCFSLILRIFLLGNKGHILMLTNYCCFVYGSYLWYTFTRR